MLPNELFATSGDTGGNYEILKSLRFRSSSLANLSKSYTNTNPDSSLLKKTYSFWVKRGQLTTAAYQALISNYVDANNYWWFGFNPSDQLYFYNTNGSSAGSGCNKITTQVFRDPSAHYHIMLVIDTTQAVAEERVRIYVNGKRITSFGTNANPSQNTYVGWFAPLSGTMSARIGGYAAQSQYLDGYLSELYAIDGQALTPSYFGEWNQDTGIWRPIKYASTYGNNGFYLDFKDNSGITNLGYDKSGLSNNWTPNNFSLTAGRSYDSIDDTPTNNFATLNPLNIFNYTAASTVSEGNLFHASPAGVNAQGSRSSTIILLNGKWYLEVLVVLAQTTANMNGVHGITGINNSTAWPSTNVYINHSPTQSIISKNGVNIQTGLPGFATGDVLGIAFDLDNLTCTFYKNGVQIGSTVTGLTAGSYQISTVAITNESGAGTNFNFNFGQRPFAYSAPSGFKTLCTKNLPIPSIKRGETGFDVATYTGNGGNIQIGEYQFSRPNYLIPKSLRFKGVNSYFNRTPGAAGNRLKWTFSAWVKKNPTVGSSLICSAINASSGEYFAINSSGNLSLHDGSTGVDLALSSLMLKDTASWTHILCIYDSANGVANDRSIIYMNGVRLSATINIAQNRQSAINNAILTTLGISCTTSGVSGSYLNGYLAEVNFIDGQALDPTNFGEFDANGYWIPKAYTGTYGQNGFYLNFSDTAAVANLGYDQSGRGNNWVANNFSLTAGTTYDSMVDSPTNNYAVMDDLKSAAGFVMSNAALTLSSTGTYSISAFSDLMMNGGLYYIEVTISANANGNAIWGVVPPDFAAGSLVGSAGSYGFGHNAAGGAYYIRNNGVVTGPFSQANFPLTGTFAIAIDSTNGKMWCSDSLGNWIGGGDPVLGTNPLISNMNVDKGLLFGWSHYSTTTQTVVGSMNFGQRPFAFTPPVGAKTLRIPDIAEYTYDLETPDLVWIKCRNAAQNHMLFDSIRGAGNYLSSNTNNAQAYDANSLISFNKNGFYLGNNANVNTLNNTYVAWMWKASQSQVTNNDGSITSYVRANQALGFSVVQYTGTGANASVGHGLGLPPGLIIAKDLNDAVTVWAVQYEGYADRYILLNTNAAYVLDNTVWQNVLPDSGKFFLGSSGLANAPGKQFIAYCFTSIDGFSKIGHYTGNASADGPFVHCGFKPRFIMIKNTSVAESSMPWAIHDTERDSYNVLGNIVGAAGSAAETNVEPIDILSNGFKLRTASSHNTSGNNYIFIAFAESPFKYANAA